MQQLVLAMGRWRGLSQNRPFFAVIEPMKGGRGNAAGGPLGMVSR
jgi:hypothetical protein